MSLPPQEQLKKFINESKEALIMIPENPGADAVGSAWAFYYFLEKLGNSPTIAFSNNLSPKYGFLPKPERILTDISGSRDFVLSFDTSRNKITNFRHEEKDGRFNIYLTPEKGSIDPRDFSFILAKFKYDLVIVLDCQDLEKLGRLYNSNTDLFFEVPVVNIDYRSDNDNFGQINLVDVTASSCSEIVLKNLKNINAPLVDKNISTCLLAGIIGATDSFQKKNTTPRALSAAAELMDGGADQQEIIRWLYKTQSLHTLKLWGRVMAKINWDQETKTVWSPLSVEDFVQSRSSVMDLPLILEKLQENYAEGKFFITLYNDTPDTTIALLASTNAIGLRKIQQTVGGEIRRGILELKGDKGNIPEVAKTLVEKIKNINFQ